MGLLFQTVDIVSCCTSSIDPVFKSEWLEPGMHVTDVTWDETESEWNTFLAKVNQGLGEQAEMAEMAWMTNDPDTLPYLALRSAAMPELGAIYSIDHPPAPELLDDLD